MSEQEAPSPWTARRVFATTVVAMSVMIGFWCAYRFRGILLMFFVSTIVATAVRPVVEWLQRRGIRRSVAVILVYLSLLGILVNIAALLAPVLIEQGTELYQRLPTAYASTRSHLLESSNRLLQFIGSQMPHEFSLDRLAQQAVGEGGKSVSDAMAYVGVVSWRLFTAIATLLMAFYWTLEGERALRSAMLLVPQGRRDATRELVEAIESKLGAYLRGQAILCMVVGLLAYAAYIVLKLPNPLALAFVVGLMEAVPLLGPVLGALPAILVALSISPATALWVIGANIIIQQFESNLLGPRMMDKSVGVNPVVTLLAIAGFAALLGPIGAVLAIPLAAILQLLLGRFVLRADDYVAASSGRDYISRLRYETQDLVQAVRRRVRARDDSGAEPADGTDARLEEEIEGVATALHQTLAAHAPQEAEP